ncbi:MAG: ATP-binding protein [Candidatus Thermoplasmatota archaeon]
MLERHRRLLFKQNPQWMGKAPMPFEFRRDLFGRVYDYLQYPQIVAVVGLRRVGKTVLLRQIIADLAGTVDGRNICYISFDDRDFQNYETAEELINYFLAFSDRGSVRYLFLDEIQKVRSWPDLLKTFYDTEENLKMVVSGSSSLEMKKYRETLAGRIVTIHMPIFSFKEFVRYFGLRCTISLGDLMREYDQHFLLEKERYALLFENYLLKGAFPELLTIDEEAFIKQYIKDAVMEKIVAEIAKGREDVVYELLKVFARNTARLFDVVNLANALSLNRNAVANYVIALERAFVIKIAHNYGKSAMRQARTGKKAHIVHSCVPIALFDLPFSVTQINGVDRGYLVESTVANSLESTAFWMSPQKDEVDIVLQDNALLPVEVKYQEHITKADLKGILKFMDRFDVKEGVVVTKDILAEEKIGSKRIIYIPAWLFLLIGD